jgi:flagellar basal body P-ring formation protein FlgA
MIVATCFGVAMLIAATALARAEGDGRSIVVPLFDIPANSVIRADMLTNVVVPDDFVDDGFVTDVSEIVGKHSRRALRQRRPIEDAILLAPVAVRSGDGVKATTRLGGVQIVITATALKTGRIGDVISVRSAEPSLTLSGTVMADGSVQILSRP